MAVSFLCFKGFELVMVIIFDAIMIFTFDIDLETGKIPNKLVVVGLIMGMIFLFIPNSTYLSVSERLIGFFIGGGILLLINIITKGGMGFGDVKITAVIGLFLGLKLTLLTIAVGVILASIICIILILTTDATLKTKIAFGPFLAIAGISIVYFPSIVNLIKVVN